MGDFIYYSIKQQSLSSLKWKLQDAIEYKDDPLGRVATLSDIKFERKFFRLLNEGLIFCPTPKYHDKEQLSNDFKNFFVELNQEHTSA